MIVAADVDALLLDKPYTGAAQTSGLAEAAGYTVSESEATEAGTYSVDVTPKSGYVWDDGTSASKTFTWAIVQAENEWTTEPAISKETWDVGGDAGSLTAGVALFGSVSATLSVDNGAPSAFDGTLPTAAGSYVLTYAVAGGDDYTGLSKSLAFVIAAEALTAVDKPVVSLPSGTVFVPDGMLHKPTVTPETSDGYTVSWGDTDWTSAGTHTLTITLANGYKWSDDMLGALTYVYEFEVPAYTDYYFGATGYWGGFYGNMDGMHWYQDAARTVKAGAGGFYPDSYDAHVWLTVPDGVSADAVATAGLMPKVGRCDIGGTVTLQGGTLCFRNDTATPVPYIVLAPGSSLTVYDQAFTSSGAGYIEIGADATFISKRGSSSEDVFLRFSTTDADGATAEAQRCEPVSEFGWFEGGTADSTVNLVIQSSEKGCFRFAKAGATNGVAGALAINVGFNSSSSALTLVEVVGTLNVNAGSTLTVDANGLGVGTYSVLTAGTLNDAADLARNGTVTGLASGTWGRLVRTGNAINLVIVDDLSDLLPQVAGEDVAAADVFTKAKTTKSIVYPTAPTITGDEGAQVISFGGVDVNVPDYYTATLTGTTVTLALNDNAKPAIANEGTTPGIELVGGKVRLHLSNVKGGLYYTILSATSLDGDWTPCGAAGLGQANFEYDAISTTRFYKAAVTDVTE